MKCPSCNHENPKGNKFCAECGTRLEVNPSTIVCPKCHNHVPADSKFCPDCGMPITLHTESGTRNTDKASTIMKLLTLGDFKIGDNIYDVECEDYTKIDDNGWGFKVIKANIDDDGFEYIARVSDKRIFALAIDLAECEDSIPENWKEIGIKDNNILTSFEKVLSRLNFDWEDIDSPGDGISFISSTKWNGENIFIVGSNSHIVISLLDDETKANIYTVIKEDLVDETNESENDDDELPSCPECGSDDVDNDGSDYLQYTCNDCGHNWGHDDTVECPECGSNNVENDGTDNLQYECNDCGHIWGDDEEDGDEEDDNEIDEYDDDDAIMKKFFPVCGCITLGETSADDLRNKKYLFNEIKETNNGVIIAYAKESPDGQIRQEQNDYCFTHIYITQGDNIYNKWKSLGINWSLSYDRCIKLFERLGFQIYVEDEPHTRYYESQYSRNRYCLEASFIAESPNGYLRFKFKFDYGNENSEGYSTSSSNSLYSITCITSDSTYEYDI